MGVHGGGYHIYIYIYICIYRVFLWFLCVFKEPNGSEGCQCTPSDNSDHAPTFAYADMLVESSNPFSAKRSSKPSSRSVHISHTVTYKALLEIVLLLHLHWAETLLHSVTPSLSHSGRCVPGLVCWAAGEVRQTDLKMVAESAAVCDFAYQAFFRA